MEYLEIALTTAACAWHASFLLAGYRDVAAHGIEGALRSPLLSFAELRVGTSYPALPLTGPLFYLAAVYLLSWFMSWRTAGGRAPFFSLSGVMLVYNAYATLLSGAMFALFLQQFAAHTTWGSLLTYKLDPATTRAWAAVMWVNYQSKYIEYADTLVAVLRGKKEQVSDLQLIHHAEMGPLMYVFCLLCPGGQSALGPMINSLVHFVMYGYYGLTGAKVLGALTGAVKPYITSFQIAQFLILLAQSGFHLFYLGKYWDARCTVLQFVLMLQMVRGAGARRPAARTPLF